MDEVKLLPVEKLLRDWQTERSEWHGPVTLEVVREYAEWREARAAIEATRPTLVTDELVERAIRAALDQQGGSCADALQDGKVVPDTAIYWFYGHQIDVPALARSAIAAIGAGRN